MMRRPSAAALPTMPTGVEIASFTTYLEAQKAVDHLADEAFPVRHVSIVGTDLHLVERITGRLTYARVAGAGAMSGAWFGLMLALVLWLVNPRGGGVPMLAAVLIGAAFGILFAVVSYSLTGGKRDFTSASQVVAGRYAILCAPEHAGEARQLLAAAGRGGQVRSAPQPSAPAAPPASGNPYAPPRYGATAPGPGAPGTAGPGATPGTSPAAPAAPSGARGSERPRYGLRLEDLEPSAQPQAQPPASPAPESVPRHWHRPTGPDQGTGPGRGVGPDQGTGPGQATGAGPGQGTDETPAGGDETPAGGEHDDGGRSR
ncbi:general stress protein [Georgenia thermotolerans]|uniref:general stress protein n=2 Tax=Georgenia thermotolerans TaxID=527326 RepID=UPI00186B55B7|nr:general stress protein [Georgenia thermotolerans]